MLLADERESTSYIETFGAAGPSLVKGVVTQLSAVGVSVKQGGQIEELNIHGGLLAHGPDVLPLELGGSIASLTIQGGLKNDAVDQQSSAVAIHHLL